MFYNFKSKLIEEEPIVRISEGINNIYLSPCELNCDYSPNWVVLHLLAKNYNIKKHHLVEPNSLIEYTNSNSIYDKVMTFVMPIYRKYYDAKDINWCYLKWLCHTGHKFILGDNIDNSMVYYEARERREQDTLYLVIDKKDIEGEETGGFVIKKDDIDRCSIGSLILIDGSCLYERTLFLNMLSDKLFYREFYLSIDNNEYQKLEIDCVSIDQDQNGDMSIFLIGEYPIGNMKQKIECSLPYQEHPDKVTDYWVNIHIYSFSPEKDFDGRLRMIINT